MKLAEIHVVVRVRVGQSLEVTSLKNLWTLGLMVSGCCSLRKRKSHKASEPETA